MSTDPTRRHTLFALTALGLVGASACTDSGPVDSDTDDTGDTDVDTDTGVAGCEDETLPQTEGPFYPGEPVSRVDLREDRDGVQLDLDLEVVEQGSCAPLEDAEVDVWCADASGAYSGYATFGTEGQDWLRGQQITDAEGRARFTVIVPGSYPGRAVHLHVKVRVPGREELTTQVYLPDALVQRVLARPAYADSAPITTLGDDGFYEGDTLLRVISDDEGLVEAEGTLILA